MTATEVFAATLASRAAFSIMRDAAPENAMLQEAFALLSGFGAMATPTYLTPRRGVDTCSFCKDFETQNGAVWGKKMKGFAKALAIRCKELWEMSAIARDELDKPNLRRLFELHLRSRPALGHVRMFAELAFESAHQPLKRAIGRSNYKEAHMQAMKCHLQND